MSITKEPLDTDIAIAEGRCVINLHMIQRNTFKNLTSYWGVLTRPDGTQIYGEFSEFRIKVSDSIIDQKKS